MTNAVINLWEIQWTGETSSTLPVVILVGNYIFWVRIMYNFGQMNIILPKILLKKYTIFSMSYTNLQTCATVGFVA